MASYPSGEDMLRRIFIFVSLLGCMIQTASAETIRWVDFDVPYEALKYAREQDILTAEQEKHISWIDALALAACRTGGKCGLPSVKKAVADLKEDRSPEEILHENDRYYAYYHEAYEAALGGLLGSYAIQVN